MQLRARVLGSGRRKRNRERERERARERESEREREREGGGKDGGWVREDERVRIEKFLRERGI